MRSVGAYALAAALLLAAMALTVQMLMPEAATAIWIAAAVAYVTQLAAYGALLAGHRRRQGFVAGWGAGMGLRMVVVVAFAFWVTRLSTLPPKPALLGLVGFVFVLMLLEPIFLRIEG